MTAFLEGLGSAGWAPVALVALLAVTLFVPWREPARRAERLLRAWRGLDASPPAEEADPPRPVTGRRNRDRRSRR